MKTPSAWGLLLWCLWGLSLHNYAQEPSPPQTPFQLGINAFKQGHYQTALEHFTAARQAGNNSPNLYYNLAVTYFQLAQYDNAKVALEQLLQQPEWQAIAQFQLGLIAEKQHNPTLATRYYRQVITSDESAKLSRLARRRLGHLSASAAADPAPKNWAALLSLAYYQDDNAFSLHNDLLLKPSQGEDSYNELIGWGQHYFQGNKHNGWRLHGFIYQRGYRDYTSLDVDSYSLGVSRHLSLNQWQWEVGLDLTRTQLDGKTLSKATQATLRFVHPTASSRWEFAYMPSQIMGGTDFDQLDGWRHRLAVKWQKPMGQVTAKVSYHYDYNSRDDLQTDSEFFSYSPTRHSLALEALWQINNYWEVAIGTEYRHSEYAGTNRLNDTDDNFKAQTREADRNKHWLRLTWQPTERIQVQAKLLDVDNDENFRTYTYDKQEVGASVSFFF